MRRFRGRRFAMLMILMLTLSMVLQGTAISVFAGDYNDPLNTRFYQNTPPGNNAPGPLEVSLSGVPERTAYVPGETAKIAITLKNIGHGDNDGTNHDVLAIVKDANSNIIFNQPALNLNAVDAFDLVSGAEISYDMYYTIPLGQAPGTLNLPYTVYDYGLFTPTQVSDVEALCEPEWMHTEVGSGVIPLNIVEPGTLTIHKTVGPGYEGIKFVCFSLNPVLETPAVDGEIGAEGYRDFRNQCVRIVEGSADIVFEGLPYGEYRIEETKMPRYYTTDLASPTVVISADNLHPELTVNNLYTSPISIDKTVAPTIANVGDIVTYSFRVTNNGEYNLYHAQIKDLNIPFDAYQEGSDNPSALVYEGEFLEPGEVWTVSTTHTLTAQDLAGGSFTNTAKVKAYTCQEIRGDIPQTAPASMTEADVEAACMRICVWVEASDSATVNLPTTTTVITTTTTTTERDRAEPAGSFIPPEPVPLAAPVVTPTPVEPVILDEVIPLGVPVLPKTGELPVELFYGLGGMITAMGALLKRK